jgi:hypothetical protein
MGSRSDLDDLLIFWLDADCEHGHRSIRLGWTDGMLVSDLRPLLLNLAQRVMLPQHLLDDASAYCRWGKRLRWTTVLYGGDEIALLERISADAKQRRHDKVRRQRAIARQ